MFKIFKTTNTPTHAGGVVYQEVEGIKQYLVVTAKRSAVIWVLPKGHIDAGEKEQVTAMREVLEESGIKASVVKKIRNVVRWKWFLQRQVIAFYLMKFENVESVNREGRKIAWLTKDDAVKKLFYGSQKDVMREMDD